MKSLLLISITLTMLAIPAGAELNLIPTPSERDQEGMKFPELVFSDNGRKVTYEQPHGWTYSSQSKQKITFAPHELDAQAAIEAGNPLEPAQLDDAGLKQLRELILTLVPKDSAQIEIISETKNPIMINGHDTCEITVSYVLYGQTSQMSVLFADIEHEQLRFKVLASPKAFEQAHRAFMQSLYGLQWQR